MLPAFGRACALRGTYWNHSSPDGIEPSHTSFSLACREPAPCRLIIVVPDPERGAPAVANIAAMVRRLRLGSVVARGSEPRVRSLGWIDHVEMGRQPLAGIVAKRVGRHGHHFGPSLVEDRKTHAGECQDLPEQRHLDATTRRLDPRNLGLGESNGGSKVTLTQIAGPAHPPNDPRHVDLFRSFLNVTSLAVLPFDCHGASSERSIPNAADTRSP